MLLPARTRLLRELLAPDREEAAAEEVAAGRLGSREIDEEEEEEEETEDPAGLASA